MQATTADAMRSMTGTRYCWSVKPVPNGVQTPRGEYAREKYALPEFAHRAGCFPFHRFPFHQRPKTIVSYFIRARLFGTALADPGVSLILAPVFAAIGCYNPAELHGL
jgi:hypothetical protein